jgi:hypothetical protein
MRKKLDTRFPAVRPWFPRYVPASLFIYCFRKISRVQVQIDLRYTRRRLRFREYMARDFYLCVLIASSCICFTCGFINMVGNGLLVRLSFVGFGRCARSRNFWVQSRNIICGLCSTIRISSLFMCALLCWAWWMNPLNDFLGAIAKYYYMCFVQHD